MNKIRIQRIKNDIKKGNYSLEKITVDKREFSRKKKIKRIEKKIQKEHLTKEKMMFLFELEKELDSEYTYEGDKNNTEEIAHNWISIELNSIEGENM